MPEECTEPTKRECPYCPGALTPVEGYGAVHQCDGSDCPATFVAVLGGT